MKKLLTILMLAFALTFGAMSCEFTGSNGESPQIDSTELVIDSTAVDSLVTDAPDSLVQCTAITKKGTQCERLVAYPDTLCFQHKK